MVRWDERPTALAVAVPQRLQLYADKTRTPISIMGPERQRILDGKDLRQAWLPEYPSPADAHA